MHVIDIAHITKDYGNGKGVFDVCFHADKGEVIGFLGPNGAGKTTTIRQLMGFIRPDAGSVSINGLDCFRSADRIQQSLGYLPGEIAFLEDMTGIEFIKFIANMKHMPSLARAEELMRFFELDASGAIKKMSKGMKQKIGIVCAFMQNPDILILDEPTSGLDPLMQNKFIELLLAEKARGKTILMSSHVFEEVERTSDRTAIIRQGRIVAVESMENLRQNKRKIYEVRFHDAQEAAAFAAAHGGAWDESGKSVTVQVAGNVDAFIKAVSAYRVEDLQGRTQTLEELFMHFYGEEGTQNA
ncbi:MAG: ABC transporter ATP-binding protein [Oscillospiraceae bacterium]|nr:ABC transporter ATP-binding protein [Oscillospiraceae bacterium]